MTINKIQETIERCNYALDCISKRCQEIDKQITNLKKEKYSYTEVQKTIEKELYVIEELDNIYKNKESEKTLNFHLSTAYKYIEIYQMLVEGYELTKEFRMKT